jgi:hypothetical protein
VWEDSLQTTLFDTIGERWDTISSVDLLKDVEVVAVEKQSDMLNEVRLMEAKQDRNEPVRKFLERLRGLANICSMTVTCPHTPSSAVSYTQRSIHTALVKGLYDTETKGEILSKVDMPTLADTVTFVEARETGKRSLAGLSGTLAGQSIHGVRDFSKFKCWNCGELGHKGDAPLPVRKKLCKAFDKKCDKCGKTGHLTKLCKNKTNDKEKSGANINVVSMCGLGSMRRNYSTKIHRLTKSSRQEGQRSMMLSNEEHDKHQERFVEKLAAPPPTIKFSIRVDCKAYHEHVPRLECMMTKKMQASKELTVPYLFRPTADTGAQVTVLGDEHLGKLGLDITGLHHSKVTMDCANNKVLETIGVFFGYIRGTSVSTEETLYHRGMVYVVKGSIMLLSETALRDLGVIPDTFPQLGQFGGNVVMDDGTCRFARGKYLTAHAAAAHASTCTCRCTCRCTC